MGHAAVMTAFVATVTSFAQPKSAFLTAKPKLNAGAALLQAKENARSKFAAANSASVALLQISAISTKAARLRLADVGLLPKRLVHFTLPRSETLLTTSPGRRLERAIRWLLKTWT